MSDDEIDYINFTKAKRPNGSTLRELFENHIMPQRNSDNLNDIDLSNFAQDESEIANLNYNVDNQHENENPRIRHQRVRIEDNRGDSVERNEISNWNYSRDLISAQHRTTSIHRNIDRRQNASTRTIPRNLEERRKWVSQAATLNRQPLLEHAQKILAYMQQDSVLMTEDPEGEILRREALRNMPQSLAVKKIIKRKFLNSISNNTKTIGCGKLLKYKISIWWSHMKSEFKNFTNSSELWYNSLKTIEGNFGSGVSTYFKFLRRLFILNLYITFFSVCFIIVPQVVFTINGNGTNVTLVKNTATFNVGDLFTGAGYLSNTVMYYGFYTNGRINDKYSMTDAYFYTMICLFVSNAVVLGVSMARSYRKSFIETMGGSQNLFAHKIFCGWDYGIATRKASNLQSSSIYTELRELLSDYININENRECMQTFLVVSLQLAGHIFISVLVAATGFFMWTLLEQHRTRIGEDDDATLTAILTALFVNIIMLLFPMLFRLIGSYEGYKSPRVTVVVTFLRTLALEIVVVGILIVFWLTQSDNKICWENSLGQEIYRLIIFDFFFSVIFNSLFEVSRYFLHKKIKRLEAPEFDISGNTFSVIYNQTLFWLGMYFAPLLGVVIILKMFLTWYVRSWILLAFCVPPKKSWRAAQTETLFLIITFISSLLLLFVYGYIMINIRTSDMCGPFRHIDFMHMVFLNALTELDSGNKFLVFLNFISKPGVIALILIGMSMLAYYLRSKSIAQIDFVTFLRRRLVLAAQDKEFLLRHINQVTNGDWHHQVNQTHEDAIDPSIFPPHMPNSVKLTEHGDVLPGTSSDDLLVTSSTTSFPFSDSSVSEYLHSQGTD